MIRRRNRLSDSELERQLAAVLEQATAAMDQGQPIDPSALAREHPECADALNQLLPVLIELRQWDAAPEVGPFEDFRVVRPLGRGGMGIVYEAEQQSLGRRVALKVLPFASVLDERRLSRFRLEAQAAAGLQHEHIVPVFSIGCERGVHYYAMQLIDGITLAEVLRANPPASALDRDAASADDSATKPRSGSAGGLSTPPVTGDPRQVARWGAEAADALQHAHQRGVIHRDVKPSNLMVDQNGKLWVTDFGLARVRNEVGLSATGDIVGTLRYMSPEQLGGGRSPVDERTDVFSLGVTLYELLTGQVPQEDTAFHQLGSDEVAAPSSRPCNPNCPKIPEDLKTIVLKAISHAPEDRYRTAGELSADLFRFLDDRPILARRPTPLQRMARWGRRRKSLLRGLTVAGLLSLLAIGISGALAWRAMSREAAEQDRAKALSAQLQQEKRVSYDRRDLAESNSEAALLGIQRIAATVSSHYQSEYQPLRDEDRAILQDALRAFEALAAVAPKSPLHSRQILKARIQVVEMHFALRQYDQARNNLAKVVDHMQRDVVPPAELPQHSLALADHTRKLAELELITNRLDACRKHLDQAQHLLVRCQSLGLEGMPVQMQRLRIELILANLEAQGLDLDAAIARLNKSLAGISELQKQVPDDEQLPWLLLPTLESLGNLYETKMRFKDGRRMYQRAVDVAKQKALEGPRIASLYEGLARNTIWDDPQASEQALAEARKLIREGLRKSPQDARWVIRSQRCDWTLGTLRLQHMDFVGAEQAFRRCLETEAAHPKTLKILLPSLNPQPINVRRELVMALHFQEKMDEALSVAREGVTLALELRDRHRGDLRYERMACDALYLRADAEYQSRKNDEAQATLREAITGGQRALKAAPPKTRIERRYYLDLHQSVLIAQYLQKTIAGTLADFEAGMPGVIVESVEIEGFRIEQGGVAPPP